MVEFRTFEDILDFAILQEKAAQHFYHDLAGRVTDAQVRLFYRTLVEEESLHEKELTKLKKQAYQLKEPDLQMLRKSGYLAALPARPDITLREAIEYALKKERSARMLYSLLAGCAKQPELAQLFQTLSAQEQMHADYFQKQLDELPALLNDPSA